MRGIATSQLHCPYCAAPISERSEDHIFSQFLGGKKEIESCKPCNDQFGHTFESRARKTLLQIEAFISSRRVSLHNPNAVWKKAFTKDSETYDVFAGEKGLILHSSKPILEFYDDGKLKTGKYRTRKEAENVVRSLIKKGKASETLRIEEEPPRQIDFDLPLSLEIGGDLKRLALKMCIGLMTFLPEFHLREVQEARLYLRGNPDLVLVNNVFCAFDTFETIDSNRQPLSHVIYVERGDINVYGLVQFFGCIQLYCLLGNPQNSAQPIACIATLDPVSGNEQFSEISPLGLIRPPFVTLEESRKLAEQWMIKLNSEALKRSSNPTK